MDTASPLKRRALAPLDANALAPSPKPSNVKRVLDAPMSPAPKKPCLERDEDPARSRSHSPDTSSVFDTSTGDASWATVATDVDVEAMTRTRRAVPLTRDQAREKAEILRLRLGLASYKLRTGQTTVPLADLQLKPLPSRPTSAPRPAKNTDTNTDTNTDKNAETTEEDDAKDDDAKAQHTESPLKSALLLPRLESALPAVTPQKRRLQDEGRLTSSALRGGAASGLLSLARGPGSDE